MTTLNVIRADTFVAEARVLDVRLVDVPVVGGHNSITILPLLSQASPPVTFSENEAAELTDHIRRAGIQVLGLKAGSVSSTLATGEQNIYEAAYLECGITEADFCASKVRLGPNGAEEVLPIDKIPFWEEQEFTELTLVLKKSIEKNRAFVREHK